MRVLRIYPAANDPRHREREKALRRAGIDVGLVLPHSYGSDWNSSPVEPDIPHWRSGLLMKNSIRLHLWNPSALRRAVREFDPDVVDVHEEPFFPSGLQGVLTAGGRPVVMYSAQNMDKHLPAPIRVMQRVVFRRLSGMYPCSQGAADLLRRRGFTGRITVVPIGVESRLFEVRPHGDRVGFIGRLVPEKGVRHLLGFGSRLLCLGDGPLAGEVRASGAEVRRVKDLASLAAGLAEMRVLVAPSLTTSTWKEQFGRMVVEAMAAGVPVVAYRSGSLEEVIGDAGELVEEADRPGLEAAIARVLDDPGDYAERGRARARAEFGWDRVAARMSEVYGDALTLERRAS